MEEFLMDVPEEMMKQLHEAIAKFHEKRLRHETMVKSSEMRHEEKVEKLRDELHEAEKELEEITWKIQQELDKPKE
jgi:tRNA G37 N-methylase TrmD